MKKPANKTMQKRATILELSMLQKQMLNIIKKKL